MGTSAAAEDAFTVHEDSQSLKREVLDLDRDLRVLEEKLLYPAAGRFTVFVVTDTGIFFRLDSVRVLLDGTEIGRYTYSPIAERALLRGAAHQIYVGNATGGGHQLVAFLSGRNAKGKPYRRGVSLGFDQTANPQVIELRVSDSGDLQQAEFTARIVPQ